MVLLEIKSPLYILPLIFVGHKKLKVLSSEVAYLCFNLKIRMTLAMMKDLKELHKRIIEQQVSNWP